ncbi:hypothetical protein RN001_002406 [Aquatica leii]|uniref:Uncharacterized protein n=1 Tax=Aquatica leii TaxID=1421715 RepID=A0AAN7PDD6_9COLE|nr:hypothetical protein RN001_002406 [Aquatica leii]
MPETRQASRMELNDDERIEKTIEKVLNNQSFIKRIVETATAVIRELYEERIKALEAKLSLLIVVISPREEFLSKMTRKARHAGTLDLTNFKYCFYSRANYQFVCNKVPMKTKE